MVAHGRRCAGGALAVLLAGMLPAGPVDAHAAALSEQETHAIGVTAYTYFYSLVTMDLTRKQLTNVVRPEGLAAPPNSFANIPAYPDAAMKTVVRPNFDTLYSSAWLDLSKEPMIVTVPDTHGRYYLLPMLDMWTDVFASPGWRTTGTAAAEFAIVPPGWTGTLPDGVTRIDAPTPTVWIIGRIKTDGPADYDAVHQIQAGLQVTPLARWGQPAAPVSGTVDPAIDMKTPPKVAVDAMPADRFFAYAAEILKSQPPHATDQPILAQLRRIGFEAGKSFDLGTLDAATRRALESAPADARRLMAWKVRSLARAANGWVMNTDTMGVYGTFYLKRAIVTQLGLGANLPEDAIYPLNLGDSAGRPLDGGRAYSIHFEKAMLPPVDAFWSITLYDAEGYQVANDLDRFAVSSYMPFQYNPDGSLDLYVQHAKPDEAAQSNWLPAPSGGFNLTMRLYAPRSDALTGKWNPPPVMDDSQAKPLLAPMQQ